MTCGPAFDARASQIMFYASLWLFFGVVHPALRTSRLGKGNPLLRRVFDTCRSKSKNPLYKKSKKNQKNHDVPRDSPLFMSSKLLGK